MKSFFKMLLATILGIILTFVLITFFFIIVAAAMLSQESVPVIKPKSVLKLELTGSIEERVQDNPFGNSFSLFNTTNSLGLNDLISNIKKAKEDKNIEGIYLDISDISASYATLEELRNSLEDFKESEKFVYCYSKRLTQPSYYLATAATKVYMHPEGLIELRGLSSQILFFKGLLDKLDIDVQVVKHGTFKSAVEPFLLDKMSEANKLQVQTYMGSIWNQVVSDIGKSRSIDNQVINTVCDSLSLLGDNPLAVKLGFIDSLIYKNEFEDIVRTKLELDSSEKNIRFVSLKDYKKVASIEKKSKDKIAVIYAVGDIIDDKGGHAQIGSSTAEELAKARKDKNIKAIVLRINSGGGSALMSDLIWHEVVLTQKEKPIVVSMGNHAASGGYYIACAADYIVAQPTTITGSIGVFGVFPNFQRTLEKKLGVTIDRVNTNTFSDALTGMRPLTDYEVTRLQKMIDGTYSTFLQRVADGRNLTTKFVDSVGQGRVWSGTDALQRGLVDTLGGLDAAVAKAAQLANIETFSTVEHPKMKNFFEEFMETFLNSTVSNQMQKSSLYETYMYLQFIESVLKLEGVQARMPYIISIY